jgi:hypothetical protein
VQERPHRTGDVQRFGAGISALAAVDRVRRRRDGEQRQGGERSDDEDRDEHRPARLSQAIHARNTLLFEWPLLNIRRS